MLQSRHDIFMFVLFLVHLCFQGSLQVFFLSPFLLRIFSFDERQNKFLLLAQSQYLKRCVLTVSHVIDFRTSGKPLVMLFAGDTAGRISCWDVTELLLNHVKEYYDFICGEYGLMKNVSGKECGNQVAAEKRTVCEADTVNKSSEKSILGGNIYLEKYDTALNNVTSRDVKESVTTDSVTAMNNQDKSENESVTNPDGCLTDTTESEKFAVIDHLTVKQDAGNRNEQTAITSETTDQTSLNDGDDQEFNTEFVEQSDFSCLPLVPVFLKVPTHVFQAHQSGVNAISLVKSQGKTELKHLFYLVVLVFY